MRDSQPFRLCAVSCLASPFHFLISTFSSGLSPVPSLLSSPGFAPWRLRRCLLRQCRLFVSFLAPSPDSSNIQTKSRDFQAILRQNRHFIKIVPGISGHFRALRWGKWVKSSSILRQYRHFTRQSAYAHSPPSGHSGHFSGVRGVLRKLARVFRGISPIDALAANLPDRGGFPTFFTLHCKVSRRPFHPGGDFMGGGTA